MMAKPVEPGIGSTRDVSRAASARKTDWEPIHELHQGQRHHRPYQQAGHMSAPDRNARRHFLLATQGTSTHETSVRRVLSVGSSLVERAIAAQRFGARIGRPSRPMNQNLMLRKLRLCRDSWASGRLGMPALTSGPAPIPRSIHLPAPPSAPGRRAGCARPAPPRPKPTEPRQPRCSHAGPP